MDRMDRMPDRMDACCRMDGCIYIWMDAGPDAGRKAGRQEGRKEGRKVGRKVGRYRH